MRTPRPPQYVALDRDGTVIRYVPYLTKPEDVQLVSSAGFAIARLNRAGTRVVLVTNQSVVARGALTLESLGEIHEKVSGLLAEQDAHLDAILVCPHAPKDHCQCRKPEPGLLARYLEQERLTPRNGYVVGDNVTDMELAFNIGAKPVHVQGGVHSTLEVAARYAQIPSVADLGEAVDFILGSSNDG